MIQRVKTNINRLLTTVTTFAARRVVLWTVLALGLGLFIITQLTKPTPTTVAQNIVLPAPALVTQKPVKPQQPLSKLPGTWQTVTVKPGDNMAVIFTRLGLSKQQLQQIVALGNATKPLTLLKPGQKIRFKITPQKQLTALTFNPGPTEVFTIVHNQGQFKARLKTLPVETRIAYAHATIRQSLAQAASQSNIPYGLVVQLANIFGWEINFSKQIQKGDEFRIAYQEYYVNGKKIRDGDIVSAQFVNNGKTYSAVRYTTPKGYTAYYNLAGRNLGRPFLRYPVKYTRISSYYTNGRKHPILHRIRAHKGVDYAAPRGTPITAVGDGTIAHLGRKGGYGKTVVIKHNNKYHTLYAHMSKYAQNLKRGSKVKQGQVIGYVGSTGLATGPHLHYEFHINGHHQNPLKVKLPSGKPLPQAYLAKFKAKAQTMIANLDNYQQTMLAAK